MSLHSASFSGLCRPSDAPSVVPSIKLCWVLFSFCHPPESFGRRHTQASLYSELKFLYVPVEFMGLNFSAYFAHVAIYIDFYSLREYRSGQSKSQSLGQNKIGVNTLLRKGQTGITSFVGIQDLLESLTSCTISCLYDFSQFDCSITGGREVVID